MHKASGKHSPRFQVTTNKSFDLENSLVGQEEKCNH